MKKVTINTNETIKKLKRLAVAGVACQQAMLGFGKAARLIRPSVPVHGDWRKFTLRN